MIEPEDLLQTTYNNLKRAIDTYEDCHRAFKLCLEGHPLRGDKGGAFERAMRNYDKREKEFNQQISNRIRESGNVPTLAEEMLHHQRCHGFHARGLVKILSVHKNKLKRTVIHDS